MEEEPPRKSLLDVLQERAAKVGKFEKAHRIMYAAHLNPNTADVGSLTRRLLASHEMEGEEEMQFTGLLLQLPGCVIHILEGHQDNIVAFCRQLEEMDPDSTGVLNPKLLSTMQDIPARVFPMWGSRILTPAKVPGEPLVPEKDQIPVLVPEMSLQLQKMGHKLQEMGTDERRLALDALKNKFAEFVPRVEDVMGLIESPDVPTISQYLDIYYRPIELALDSELVWPLPPPLTY
mmetsp:Transcript_35174/g.80227  ORF Transcript_35174/g.80227 Transcript_35174/m.80227 type:complete len:234 (-) Transcript_35174:123-824(-)|eukprot:CAMPEP_0114563334 /NCGR_PEP_ID=MMETSP0114-20121206/13049_1 /TAXON_ID=31324 /ORGANISM="Goniomonas sp, Strain m" /LENGTH=233 /DNA_ID=CAMNT_0001749163 /DNA_START=42 /DNA_END=743 /DNA_ORIENTATION=+